MVVEGAQLGIILIPAVMCEKRWREQHPGFLLRRLSPGVSNCRVNTQCPELGMEQGTDMSGVIPATRAHDDIRPPETKHLKRRRISFTSLDSKTGGGHELNIYIQINQGLL